MRSDDRTIRQIETYDPSADLADRHAGWKIEATDLHGIGEVFDVPRRLILVDSAKRGTQYAIAHAIAHLDLGHVDPCGSGSFTAQQENDAHGLALIKLDREADRECA